MSTPHKLAGIRIQTARMLEIYSLLRREFDGSNKIGMPDQARRQLESAASTQPKPRNSKKSSMPTQMARRTERHRGVTGPTGHSPVPTC